MSGALPPLLHAAARHPERPALDAADGRRTYGELLARSAAVAARLAGDAGGDLAEARVAVHVPPGAAWVETVWGVWRAGGVAVPLALASPPAETARALDDCGATTLVADAGAAPALAPLAAERGVRLLVAGEADAAGGGVAAAPRVAGWADRGALLLFTSGTTGRPKGAVLTHGNLDAQVAALHAAWAWSEADVILSVLPLHHLHGIVNVVGCALAAGARCLLQPRFDPEAVWDRLAGRGDACGEPAVTLFMAVPTIYSRLVAAWEAATPARRAEWSAGARRLRLMVSGSAALPPDLFARWEEIAGHRLLERYGMTEIGMALSNPLAGLRRPGTVGTPLPGVEARLVGDDDREIHGDGVAGDLEVRGPAVFRGYHGDPAATAAAFLPAAGGSWFRTGDVAVREDGIYRLLGRRSVDVLKTGGEKVSALEVEAVLRRHPAVDDCAVVGLPDPDWGQRVTAAVLLRPGATVDPADLRAFARDHLAAWKAPKDVVVLGDLPRNALGKVQKPALAALLTAKAGGP